MKIAVAGGKGGTGKTLVATALALHFAKDNINVAYLDADAEGPNGALFLKPRIERVIPYGVLIPALNAQKCSGCGNCQSICAFNAIVAVGRQIMVFPELCHSCGACFIACADGMLARQNRHIGNISVGHAGPLRFYEASLNVGEARVSPLISGAVSMVGDEHADVTIIDNPPGTACAAVAAQDRADMVVLVTEPTPFGYHDLQLAVTLGRKLNKPMVAVLNRVDLGEPDKVIAFLTEAGIPLAAQIPFEMDIATLTAEGQSPFSHVVTFDAAIARLAASLSLPATKKEGNV